MVKPDHNQAAGCPASRREFIRSAGRYGILAGIAAVTVAVVRTRQPSANQACLGNSICHGCLELAGCRLPPALLVKGTVQKG